MSDAGTLVGEGYGRTVGLRGEPACLEAAAAELPFWWRGSAAEPEQVLEVGSPASAGLVVRELEHWLAEHAVDVVFVHAAAVAVGGRVLLLPGRSFSGKSTLCAALLRAGATYLSDEYAVLDDAGLVHPYPRPLLLRDGADRTSVPAADLGASTATEPLPVGLVATLRHEPEAGWEVSEVPAAQAVLDLIDNAVAARSRPEAVLDAVAAGLAGGAGCLRGTRGDADDAAARLVASLD